ncbi:hypothetical protein AJ87_45460 [Rhizobium yanglingense]|nr:hypothetical protein AJ87_45460 [Rhizobium yanglingense]
MGRCADFLNLLDARRVACALSRGDHGIGVEESKVAGQFLDRAVGGDGVCAMLDVAVGENPNVLGSQHRPVAHRLRRAAFNEALIRDIGVGPLVDPDKLRAAAMAMANDGIGAFARTLIPRGTSTARAMRSVTTDMKAAVSGPISSGFEKGMSP